MRNFPILFFMSTLQRFTYSTWFALTASAIPAAVFAQIGGPNPNVGNLPAPQAGGVNIRTIILNILTWVLNFLALLAVVYIVIAGIRLIVSQGEDEQKGKAKKTILFVIVGLIVIILARIIVGFITNDVPGIINGNPIS
jgi:succinate dehydrogenase/fumarate reductase cytochrome b subunit